MLSYGAVEAQQDVPQSLPLVHSEPVELEKTKSPSTSKQAQQSESKTNFASCLIYAIINVIIAVPGLYGYASVIFNHPCFQPEIAKLSKLVVFSSLVHQLCFTIFSSLNFAIGTVQDAGLIFLSAMSNQIADSILSGGGTIDEVVSTTLVVLPLGTAALGIVLIFLGKFKLLDIVSYLPMPVIGGYLAFIGYFCFEAGVALCIGKPMTELKHWAYLLEPQSLLLATPGLLSALLLTIISRKATNDAILPLAMVLIPASFYALLLIFGVSLDEAREAGWVGQVAPPVQAKDLLHILDYKLVHWHLVSKCIGTWLGMLFVVSFASALDIAAISMDMGEALDTNGEMVTVGIANCMSGCFFGFTGSYIFSQTIFTYRTGCHSRWVGILVMIFYAAVCISTVNILQIAPLFFLGATLIFIGYDLLWEWLVEIREKIFLMEYIVLLITFVAIQIIGMDFGILFGVVVALVDHVASTTRVSSMSRVTRRSRAVWGADDFNILQLHGYGANNIRTIEITGPVFFGSSQKLLDDMTKELNLNVTDEEVEKIACASPHVRTQVSRRRSRARTRSQMQSPSQPHYVVLDLSQMTNLDASAASSCFLQLVNLCEKRGIFICASCASSRIEWVLRSHNVAYSYDEELEIKNRILTKEQDARPHLHKMLLFLTVFEALEFSERMLIHKYTAKMPRLNPLMTLSSRLSLESPHNQLTYIIQQILRERLTEEDKTLVDGLVPFYEEIKYKAADPIFRKNTHSDAFYIVTEGLVAVPQELPGAPSPLMLSQKRSLSRTSLLRLVSREEDEGNSMYLTSKIESFHKIGGVFGYVDFLLDRYRTFDAVAHGDCTLAVFSRASMEKLREDNHKLYTIVQGLLLQASLLDLANTSGPN